MATTLKKEPVSYRSAITPVLGESSARLKEVMAQYLHGDDRSETLEDKIRQLVDAFREVVPLPRRSGVVQALLRGVDAQIRLREMEGGHMSADEVRVLVGVNSRQAVFDRYHKGLLLGWRGKQKAVRFPVWQFAAGEMLPGLPEVLQELRDKPHLDDWARVLFFLSPREGLDGQRPLDLLRNGQVEKVLSLARVYGE